MFKKREFGNKNKCFLVFFSLIVGAPKLNIPGAPENFTGGIYKCDATSPGSDCELLLQNEYSKLNILLPFSSLICLCTLIAYIAKKNNGPRSEVQSDHYQGS